MVAISKKGVPLHYQRKLQKSTYVSDYQKRATNHNELHDGNRSSVDC